MIQTDIRRMADVTFPQLSETVSKAFGDCDRQAPCMGLPQCAFPVNSGPSCQAIAERATEIDPDGDPWNQLETGPYIINPPGLPPKTVQCIMKPDGPGYTVIQNRISGNQSFNKNWTDYKNGFGQVVHYDTESCALGDYWIGNEYIYKIQNRHIPSLRVKIIMRDKKIPMIFF